MRITNKELEETVGEFKRKFNLYHDERGRFSSAGNAAGVIGGAIGRAIGEGVAGTREGGRQALSRLRRGQNVKIRSTDGSIATLKPVFFGKFPGLPERVANTLFGVNLHVEGKKVEGFRPNDILGSPLELVESSMVVTNKQLEEVVEEFTEEHGQ